MISSVMSGKKNTMILLGPWSFSRNITLVPVTPFLFQGVVHGPSDIISREIAVKGVKYAEKTIKIVEEFLRERIG